MKPSALDLFCGAGGVSRGLDLAGFAVVGVDKDPQPRYPYPFIRGDVFDVLEAAWLDLSVFSVIHASPPCQHFSDLAGRNGNADDHPDLIGPLREALITIGIPFVIENVEGAPLIAPVLVCGTALGLGTDGYRLRRHRLFEGHGVNVVGTGCGCPANTQPVIDVTGGGPQRAPRKKKTGGLTYKGTADQARAAMGIDWMSKSELNEAIPPAYIVALHGGEHCQPEPQRPDGVQLLLETY